MAAQPSNRSKIIILKLFKNVLNIIRYIKIQVKIKVIFTTNFRIKCFFKFRDKMPDSIQSSVIYKYTCNRCNAVYIGKTSRHLSTRIAEYMGISFRTGLTLTSPPFSQIRNHVSEEQETHHNYNINKEQFKIISKT